ncbi:Bis(5'-nucleosyl)-tetraphosphatase, symmetrical [Nitrincola lacisaponensis]|uniref:bis(5'-nucleosyl)-tetraphosphatase (symmetrical) n=1 Tax=Nitrincola lacisaponensis TaxID=267850 RepID=A0A063Y684_9GAMM|nr:symmetrical bis(5'-nucleosyl)-tetraphosphatase [Nitrincola lacisaponensis]KDE40660.1 Bis(5'-nucleosyl)-tetraphosphatase, symmetrical [Nitrincola lacisaponensis]
MATYAIGDIQGCYDELMQLLDQIGFSDSDHLWFAGDLVNRGRQSVKVLRFVAGLGDRARCVLGNHDLHLLALHFGATRDKRNSTLQQVLQAPDRDELMHWLRFRPLLVEDDALGYVMTHAGIPHIWSLGKARKRAQEVERVLRGKDAREFFNHMYGNKPDIWHNDLEGWARLRLITNYFTRMRFITPNGQLEFHGNGGVETAPAGFFPWYEVRRPSPLPRRQLFGHWAALMGHTGQADIQALDTGCVWGYSLSALCLDTQTLTQCSCAAYQSEAI